VNRPADFLIEECVLGKSLDSTIGPEGELSHIACPFVGPQHLRQELLIFSRRSFDHFPFFELESDILDLTSIVAGRISIFDIPIHALLDGAGENLSIGKVLVPVAVYPLPACNFELKIGIRANDMDFPGLVQPINEALLLFRDFPPGLNWIRFMDETTVIDEVFELAERHFRVLSEGLGRVEGTGPTQLLLSRSF
jgi:hypothetical protein